MQKVTLFMFKSCPHCQRALRYMAQVLDEHREYKDVPFEMVDEQRDPARADKYDYWYVPAFFVGDEKLHEGVITKADVERVFAKAYGETTGEGDGGTRLSFPALSLQVQQ